MLHPYSMKIGGTWMMKKLRTVDGVVKMQKLEVCGVKNELEKDDEDQLD